MARLKSNEVASNDFEPTLELALERLSAENNFAGVNFMFLENSDHM